MKVNEISQYESIHGIDRGDISVLSFQTDDNDIANEYANARLGKVGS